MIVCSQTGNTALHLAAIAESFEISRNLSRILLKKGIDVKTQNKVSIAVCSFEELAGHGFDLPPPPRPSLSVNYLSVLGGVSAHRAREARFWAVISALSLAGGHLSHQSH